MDAHDHEINRRKLLKAGVSGLAGAAVLGWTRPAMSSIGVLAQAGTPLVAGNPSVEVEKTVTEVTRISGDNFRIRGVIRITNVTDASIPVTIESVDDHVEFKGSGSSWVEATTTDVLIPCRGETIPAAGQTCEGPYEVIATIPSSAKGKRNVVEVQARNRDKVFLYRQSFEF